MPNHLKQLALGCLNHEQQHKTLPAGGWGYFWNGDPNQGFTKNQPGGWLYNVLPYIEQQAIHDIGLGDAPGSTKLHADLSRIAQNALDIFHCPSRRRPVLYPFDHTGYSYNMLPLPPGVGKNDYAGSGGELGQDNGQPYPPNAPGNTSFDSCAGPGPGAGPPPYNDPVYGSGDSMSDAQWIATTGGMMLGVFGFHRTTRLADIKDGTNYTLLAGEKNFDPNDYITGQNWGDDQTWDLGWDWDINRLVCDQWQIAQTPLPYGCLPILDMTAEGQASGIGSWAGATRARLQHGLLRRLGTRDELFDGPRDAPPAGGHGRRTEDRRQKLLSRGSRRAEMPAMWSLDRRSQRGGHSERSEESGADGDRGQILRSARNRLSGRSDGHRANCGQVLARCTFLVIGLTVPGPRAASAPGRDTPCPSPFNPHAGVEAVAMFDRNGDGKLSGDELDRCPGLKAALPRLDPGSTGAVTAKMITRGSRRCGPRAPDGGGCGASMQRQTAGRRQ